MLVALIAAGQTSHLVRLTSEELAKRGVAVDDAYFYLVIARNFPALGYMSFDGETPTNGVQPLWQTVLIAIQYLMPGHDQLAVSMGLSWGLYGIFAGLVAYFASSEARVSFLPLVALCTLVPLNPAFQRVAIQGLETPLFLVVLVVWMLMLARHCAALKASSAYASLRVASLAVCSAVLFFARTDWFVAAVVSVGVLWLTTRSVRHAALFCAVCALLVGPYLLWNWLHHGHPMPISGRVKLFYLKEFFPNWSAYLSSDEWRGMFVLFAEILHLKKAYPAALLVLAVGALGMVGWRQCPQSTRPVLLASLFHALLMYGFYRELRPYTSYYFCAEVVAAALVLTLSLERLLQRPWFQTQGWLGSSRRQWVSALVGACWVVFGALQKVRIPSVSTSWSLRIELGRELAQLPTSAKIAAFWPGALAYFADRPVFPLDGIVGSDRYFQDVVKRGGEIDYARSHGFEYIATSFASPELIASSSAPVLSTWSELGVLRLWEACKYLRGVVLDRSEGIKHWRLYGLSPSTTDWLDCPGR